MLADLLHRIERTAALDRVADPIDRVTRPLLRREPVSGLLSGAWLGHRLHPMLTDVVIGSWMSATLADLFAGRGGRAPARQLVGVGVVAALPTATAGLHDWLDYGAKVRRTGLLHAAANQVALGLQLASWAARRQGRQGRGRRLSLVALAVTGVGGYLGGHLSYVLGAGVERTALSSAPHEWTPALPLAELDPHGSRAVDVAGTPVLLVRQGETVHALADTCNHAGCSLAEGTIGEGAVTCRCHGSRFGLQDGATLAGPAAAPQPVYATRVREGVIEVRER